MPPCEGIGDLHAGHPLGNRLLRAQLTVSVSVDLSTQTSLIWESKPHALATTR